MASINKLTARSVATISEPGLHSDGGNLYLQISKAGAKSWLFVYRHGGKQRSMGLGSAGPAGVSLADARQKAAAARKLLSDGIDPIDAKRAAEAVEKPKAVFAEFADEYVKTHRESWSNPKHRQQWENTLKAYANPVIGKKTLDQIGLDDVLAILTPLWQSKQETARRVRMRIEKILDAAKVRGLRTGENPARWRGNLDHLLPKHAQKTQAHHAAMPFGDVPGFLAALAGRPATAALALRFLILTACRTSEVLGARWDEIDIEAKVWTIAADRMKSRRIHRVPLSDPALAVIEEVRGLDETFLFPGSGKSGVLSQMSMAMLLRRMDREDVTVHGFRSSFRDWASERTHYPHEVCEMALAHVIGDATVAAYRRGDLFDKRKGLMADWAAFCVPKAKPDNVVPIAEARAS